MNKDMTWEELVELVDEEIRPSALRAFQMWGARGDGIAVYENKALDSANCGHRKFVSFGSYAAMLPMDAPPTRLPDIGPDIHWAYQLVGVHGPERPKDGDPC